MKKNIIEIQTERKRKPLAAFVHSLFILGLGQMYNGELFKGTVFLLLRCLSLSTLILSVLLQPKPSYLLHVMIFILSNITITLFAACEAAFQSGRTKLLIKKYNSIPGYVLFIFINLAVTGIMITVFTIFFSFTKVVPVNKSMIFSSGDILLITRIPGPPRSRGALILDSRQRITRILGIEGDRFVCKDNLFFINGKALPFGPLTSEEKTYYQLENDDNLFYEKNAGYSYPIRTDLDLKKKHKCMIKVRKNQFTCAFDDRVKHPMPVTIKKTEVIGRIDGILFSGNTQKIFMLPQMQTPVTSAVPSEF